MMAGERYAEEVKRNGACHRDGGIKRYRKWERMIVAEINRDPGDERDPKKQIHVCPKKDRIDPGHEVNEMMMIDPVNREDDEAQDIGKKGRPHFRQGSWRRIVRGLQLQNHAGNENADKTIAECFDPVGFHGRENVARAEE